MINKGPDHATLLPVVRTDHRQRRAATGRLRRLPATSKGGPSRVSVSVWGQVLQHRNETRAHGQVPRGTSHQEPSGTRGGDFPQTHGKRGGECRGLDTSLRAHACIIPRPSASGPGRAAWTKRRTLRATGFDCNGYLIFLDCNKEP